MRRQPNTLKSRQSTNQIHNITNLYFWQCKKHTSFNVQAFKRIYILNEPIHCWCYGTDKQQQRTHTLTNYIECHKLSLSISWLDSFSSNSSSRYITRFIYRLNLLSWFYSNGIRLSYRAQVYRRNNLITKLYNKMTMNRCHTFLALYSINFICSKMSERNTNFVQNIQTPSIFCKPQSPIFLLF